MSDVDLSDLFSQLSLVPRERRKFQADPRDYGWTFEGLTAGVAPSEKYTRWFKFRGNEREQEVVLYLWPSTGTVETILEHPKQGRRPLYRPGEKMTEDDFIKVLRNPRAHSDHGYRRRKHRGVPFAQRA